MTDCPRDEMRDLLPDLLHGHLDDVRRAMVEAHVASCEACAEELALLRTMRAALAAPIPRVNVAHIVSSIPAPNRRHAPVTAVGARRGMGGGRNGWRIAAGIGLIGAILGGYALTHRAATDDTMARGIAPGDSTASPPVIAPSTQVATAPPAVRRTPVAAGRRHDSSLAAPTPSADVADAGLGFAGGVSDLADSDVQELLDHLGDIESVPDADVSTPLDLGAEGVR